MFARKIRAERYEAQHVLNNGKSWTKEPFETLPPEWLDSVSLLNPDSKSAAGLVPEIGHEVATGKTEIGTTATGTRTTGTSVTGTSTTETTTGAGTACYNFIYEGKEYVLLEHRGRFSVGGLHGGCTQKAETNGAGPFRAE